ncbi:efflux RND transporter permease subunit [Anaerosporobacter sp.]|uniref:efflux RND transporter permease subunit n=1 Tax=Anaerosporobacter sp. TaxID=1872529 RepID=UPI00286F84C7|nr:efflux RND transporter permease subunit [Anaerosporobacter sp.]
MIGFGKFITKHKKLIVILSVLLLIPAIFGYINTRVNYDILAYLPEDIETMVGQQILVDDFKTGAFSMIVIEGMEEKDVSELKSKIEQVDTVSKVIWYDSLLDISVPMTMLPDKFKDAFNTENSTMMAVTFEQSTSADETMDAITEIRKLANKQVFVSGMSAIITDTKELSEKETPIYVLIAVILSMIVLGLTMNSFLVPILFMLSIGAAIIYNLGTNIMFGEISYITKALSAVLQLGVTMDYSIFLLHSYEENKGRYPGDNDRAMAHAISNTISSVVGSSITTVAGFLALCFMSFTLGKDLGLVMAKGVVMGVITCVTLLPALILLCDKAIEKTSHGDIFPSLDGISTFVTKHYIAFAVAFIVLLVPAVYGNNNTKVYYDLTASLPDSLDSVKANKKLQDEYNMNTTHMLLIKNDVSSKDYRDMMSQIRKLDGVEWVIGLDSVLGPNVPVSMLPESLVSTVRTDLYQLELISSSYKVASDEVNDQIDKINEIVKSYSEDSLVVGEAPLTKDLIDITDIDFKNVSMVSIGVIFLIILVLFRSISLPVILVSVIEFAIFVNMGIPFYTNTTLPFIASVVIGTIQLGATVDYAILMTTRYKKERNKGKDKKEAITIAHQASIKSVIVSALSFFAATFGVGLYSNIDMISALCTLMARGALISMVVVIFVLPSMFMIFDKVICKTSMGFGVKEN